MDADFITKSELQALMNERNEACVSIFLPMERVGADVQGNPVQLKNALTGVEKELRERGWRLPDVEEMLAAPRRVVDDSPFWQHQSDGLALFISPDTFVSYRLPLAFEPLSVVSNRFHVKPILPLFSNDGRFYILALSQNQVRLFQGTRHTVDEVEFEETPTSMSDALWYDDPEEQLQHHTTTSGAAGGPGVVHHGHGVTDDEKKQRLRRYLHDVSRGVRKQLADEEGPLLLAAVDYLHPIYKEIDDSPHLLDDGIRGNPDRLSAAALHEQAWQIVEPLFTEAKEDAVSRYEELAGGEQASDQLGEIIPVAYQGRVDTLFVAVEMQAWGNYDPETGDLRLYEQQEDGGEDLLDFAAVQTLAYGGTVYAVGAEEVPGDTSIAAVFRF